MDAAGRIAAPLVVLAATVFWIYCVVCVASFYRELPCHNDEEDELGSAEEFDYEKFPLKEEELYDRRASVASERALRATLTKGLSFRRESERRIYPHSIWAESSSSTMSSVASAGFGKVQRNASYSKRARREGETEMMERLDEEELPPPPIPERFSRSSSSA